MGIQSHVEPLRWKTAAGVVLVLFACLYGLAPAVLFSGCKAGAALAAVPDRILMFDNVALEAGDLQEHYDDDDIPAGSYNEDGYYLSPRFYLFAGDTIKVIVTCDAPVALMDSYTSSDEVIQTGLNAISEENEPSANISLNYFEVTQDTSTGSMWQVTYMFPSKKLPANYYGVPSGYYQFNIFNASGRAVHCEFSITLLSS